MKQRRHRACVLAVACVATSVQAANWPQWRGPEGSGITTEKNIPTTWGADTHVRWRTPLPEAGNSSPVVWGNRVFVTQPVKDSNRRTLMALDRSTGQVMWQSGVTYDQEEKSHGTNPYCSPSPVTDGERVIAWFGSAGLVCFDMDGKTIWQRDLGPQEHMWGYGTSPILHGDLCILNFGPGTREMLIAVNKTTGEDEWRVDRMPLDEELTLSSAEHNGNAESRSEGDDLATILRGSWGTPILVDSGRRAELVVAHPRRITGYNPGTGARLWTCGDYAPLAYASPMAAGDMVIALGGWLGASLAVRTGGSGDVTETHKVWHKKSDGNWLGTGVVQDGHLYVPNIDGILSCFDAETGEAKWKHRLEPSTGRNEVWSCITMTGDGLMYLLNQSGDAFVFRPDPVGYDQVARNSIGERTNSSVVVSEGQIFIRTHKALWCIEG